MGLSRPVYRLNPRVQLHWRQFCADWVLFEALSGQTHHMSDVAAAMLMCFEVGQPLSMAALLEALVDDFGMPQEESTSPVALLAVVDQLAALGLIIPTFPMTADVAV